MNKINGSAFLLAIFLTGSPVVADDVKPVTGQSANANLTRRSVPPTSSPASATEAASATTPGTNQPSPAIIASPALPPLPTGVTELKFNEFFRQPIGPRGLEYTEKLRNLEGGRIRILGYMARQARPADHCFLLAPLPLTLDEIEYGHADDLPATTLHIITTKDAPAIAPYTPGPLLLTGTLRLGNRLEADGRMSAIRLELDPPTVEQNAAAHAAAQKVPVADPHAGHGH